MAGKFIPDNKDLTEFDKLVFSKKKSTIMDLPSRKIEFVQEFLKLQSEEVISLLERILRKENKVVDEEDFKPMSLDEFNMRIDKSLDDSKNGRLIESSDLKSKIEKWN